ncbi:hypothetical protein [Tropicimonas sp. IMCC6043]|uniref:hypothetical protein n=1 Tax=Tropicimonas sp. IMCC6043 TaxID=2510645 RepID=UPI00101C94CB|nr:hypothetical protein [Tropicimonas sp. IMCC6043]RYH11731.1 hypothetical protein EU800_03600 [Tropicimonas sp. IMCC6043]
MKPIFFIQRQYARFQSDDRGAVTVDWVVLSAAVIGMALASLNVWRDSVQYNAQDIASVASNYEIKTGF